MANSSGSESFDALKRAFEADPQLRSETEALLRLVLETYNPSNPGMRFLTGGLAEWVIAFSAYAAGVVMLPQGHGAVGIDLKAVFGAVQEAWSCKSSTQPKEADFRISNGLGGSGKGFADPTIFMAPLLPGLVFAHPDVHNHVVSSQQVKADAVTMPFRAIAEHANAHPECVIEMKIPHNQGRGSTDATFDAVKLLVAGHGFPLLGKLLKDANPVQNSVADELTRLRKMLDDGFISQEIYDAGCRKAVDI